LRYIIALYFISFISSASTCMTSDKQIALWNEKYVSLFKVSTEKNNNSFNVQVSLPNNIEGKIFKAVWLVVGDDNDPSFIAPLSTYEEDSKTKVWFVVKPNNNDKNVLIFSYGEGCGISVDVPIEL
jgi:hypothetical protein